MPYEIDIEVDAEVPDDYKALLAQAVTIAMDEVDAPAGSGVAIVLADDAYLQSLNTQFRQEDHPTDVLSFPAGEPFLGQPQDIPYLGDIAISVPYAQRQADLQGHLLVDELRLLAIHGILHLVGYDHSTPNEKQDMWGQQQLILEKLGLGHIQPTEGDGGTG